MVRLFLFAQPYLVTLLQVWLFISFTSTLGQYSGSLVAYLRHGGVSTAEQVWLLLTYFNALIGMLVQTALAAILVRSLSDLG